MSRRFAVVGVVLSLLGSGLAVPAGAGAKPSLPPRSQPVAVFQLKGTGGYSLTFIGKGRAVGLLAVKDSGAVASYETRGRVTPAGIRARFGRLGRVAVEFRPTGRVLHLRPPRGCRGGVRKAFGGVFAGTIRFRGEQGYTRGGAGRARGLMEVGPTWRCKNPQNARGRAAGPSLPELGTIGTTLGATSTRGRLAFGAAAVKRSGKPSEALFSVSSTERRGGMAIERAAVAFGPKRTFVLDTGLGTATVSPPPPFRGSATLTPAPDGTTHWTGSLEVDLPGRRGVPLATPSFTASLSQPSG